MRNLVMTSLILCGAAALIGTQALAQAPAAPPAAGGTADGMPFDIPYGAPIGLEAAQKLIAAVEAEATKHRWKMNIAVVDTHGDLVAFARMDGAQLGIDQHFPGQGPHGGTLPARVARLLQRLRVRPRLRGDARPDVDRLAWRLAPGRGRQDCRRHRLQRRDR